MIFEWVDKFRLRFSTYLKDTYISKIPKTQYKRIFGYFFIETIMLQNTQRRLLDYISYLSTFTFIHYRHHESNQKA